MRPTAILESVLYADDLAAAARFYEHVLGLEKVTQDEGRHVFFRCGSQMLLIFDPDATLKPPAAGGLPVPAHGGRGPGHLCFRATAGEIAAWKLRLEAEGVEIEADFEWPQGGRSLYFRDPAGNSIEFAEARIWGL